MKFILFFSILIALDTLAQVPGIAINSNGLPPNTSAILDVSSTTQGFLLPRMTQNERNLINGVQGLIIFQTDVAPGFYFYNGTNWQVLGAGSSSSGGSSLWSLNGNNISYNNGNVGVGSSSPVSQLHIVGARDNNSNAEGVHVGQSSSDYGIEITSPGNYSLIDFKKTTGNADYQGRIIYDLNSNLMSFHTNTSFSMAIDPSGNVGIGHWNPSERLHVNGKIKIDDGANPYTLPASDGTNGQVLTTDGSGNATWSTPASSSSQTYAIGPNAALGGYVLYVTPDGKHGLVVANQDQTTPFGSYALSNYVPSNIQGVMNCNDPLYHDAAGKNFYDWRLPKLEELSMMYNAKNTIGAFTNTHPYFYWSSTASQGGIQPLVIDFSNGNISTTGWSNQYRCRCVRSF